MSELHSQFVKRGFWVNLGQGSVLGPTITTDTRTGALIIALLAVCTTLGMSHLWTLCTFIWYQIRADGRPKDGLSLQQQALFRTLPAASTMMTDSLRLLLAWKGRSKTRSLRRTALSAVVAVVFAICTLAAGVFSSNAVTGSNLEVLVSSRFCGMAESKPDASGQSNGGYRTKAWDASEQYADECYGVEGIAPSRCNIFITPRLPFTVTNASCPFASPELCLSESIALDTGLIDLNDGLGLNLPKEDHVKFRQKMTCSVLKQDGLTTVVDATVLPPHFTPFEPLPGEQFLLYHLGPTRDGSEWSNSTFGFDLISNNRSNQISHRCLPYFPSAGKSGNYFNMIPGLEATDAATYIHIILKGNMLFYNTTIEDPIFAAHRQTSYLEISRPENRTAYWSDEPSSLIGCAAQYQFCVATPKSGEKCTKMDGLPLNVTVPFPDASGAQAAALEVLHSALAIFADRALSRLDASRMTENYFEIASLPNDQWVREMKRWVSAGLSSVQTRMADYAIGPAVRDVKAAEFYEMPPPTEGGQTLCRIQRMRKPGGFVNINVFALAFVITFSVIVVILDIAVLRFMIYLSKFKKALSPRLDRWIQDGIYQMQHHAYAGQGRWENLDQEIPVTAPGVMFWDLKKAPEPSLPATPNLHPLTASSGNVSLATSLSAPPQHPTVGIAAPVSDHTITATAPAPVLLSAMTNVRQSESDTNTGAPPTLPTTTVDSQQLASHISPQESSTSAIVNPTSTDEGSIYQTASRPCSHSASFLSGRHGSLHQDAAPRTTTEPAAMQPHLNGALTM